MGREVASEFPVAAELFERADETLGRKLSEIAWNGPIEELTRTANCQPALYVHGLACLAALRESAGDFPIEAVAGLSLGEWTAHAAARDLRLRDRLAAGGEARPSIWKPLARRPAVRWPR